MPTVIDSLVVTLGLDSSQFKKDVKEVESMLAKFRAQMAADSKKIEDSVGGVSRNIDRVKNTVMSLFAVLLAGRGFKEFISDINAANLALANFSRNMGVSPQAVSELGILIQRIGGDAKDAMKAFNVANDLIQGLHTGKGLPDPLKRMMAVGKQSFDDTSPQKGIESLARILSVYAAIDKSQEVFLAGQLGITNELNIALVDYGKNLGKAEESVSRLAPKDEDLTATKNLVKAWAELVQEVERFGRELNTAFSPGMVSIIEHLTDIMGHFHTGPDTPAEAKEKEDYNREWQRNKDIIHQKRINKNMLGRGSGIHSDLYANSGMFDNMRGRGIKRGFMYNLLFGGGMSQSQFQSQMGDQGSEGASGPMGASGGELTANGRMIDFGNPMPVILVKALTDLNGGFTDPFTGDRIERGSSRGGGGGDGGGGLGSGKHGGGLSDSYGGGAHATSAEGKRRASHLLNMMMNEYGLTKDQAMGAVGVMGYESGDFRTMQEGGQAPGRGGWGYAQWTGPRRHAFMSWVGQNHLDPSSVEANEGFLKYEIAHNQQYQNAIAALKKTKTVREAAYSWEHNFEGMREGGQGIPAFGAHMNRAEAYSRDPGINGAAGAAALNNIGAEYNASTSTSTNSMHIGNIHVNAPNATDANGIAKEISPALDRYGFSQFANSGPM